MEKQIRMEKSGQHNKTDSNETDSVPYEKKYKKRGLLFVIYFLIGIALLLGGCGKRECAICKKEAERKLSVGGKELNICEDCYQTYIETQQLFDEEP